MKELKLGVTGSRNGLSREQFLNVQAWLEKPFWGRDIELVEFHHGDCVGVDVEVAGMVRERHPDCKIICHPPEKQELRGFFESDEYRDEKSYFARNRDIVNESDVLIGFPAHRSRSKGGTWYTINYAEKQKTKTGIFYTDGKKEMLN